MRSLHVDLPAFAAKKNADPAAPGFEMKAGGQQRAVLGEKLNIDAFRHKVLAREFLEDTGEKRPMAGASRPSSLFRLAGGAAVFDRRL